MSLKFFPAGAIILVLKFAPSPQGRCWGARVRENGVAVWASQKPQWRQRKTRLSGPLQDQRVPLNQTQDLFYFWICPFTAGTQWHVVHFFGWMSGMNVFPMAIHIGRMKIHRKFLTSMCPRSHIPKKIRRVATCEANILPKVPWFIATLACPMFIFHDVKIRCGWYEWGGKIN